MAGYEIVEMKVEGRALVGRVRMTADDGRSEIRRYCWPLGTPTEQVVQLLPGLYGAWVAEGIQTPAPAILDLVGARFAPDADGKFVRLPAEPAPPEAIPEAAPPAEVQK